MQWDSQQRLTQFQHSCTMSLECVYSRLACGPLYACYTHVSQGQVLIRFDQVRFKQNHTHILHDMYILHWFVVYVKPSKQQRDISSLVNSWSNTMLEWIYPEIITIPPSGVAGPSTLNLLTLGKFFFIGLIRYKAYCSRAKTKHQILPEKIKPPPTMAGPANRCFANLGWSDNNSMASPLYTWWNDKWFETNDVVFINARHSSMQSPMHGCYRQSHAHVVEGHELPHLRLQKRSKYNFWHTSECPSYHSDRNYASQVTILDSCVYRL